MQNKTLEKCGIKLLKSAERGGWPENLDVPPEDFGVIPKSYIESIVTKDMHEDEDRKRSPNKMRMLIRSLSGIVML